MRSHIIKKLLKASLFTLFSVITSGCSSNVARMHKYDPSLAADDKAIIIVGTKNLTLVDFTKYEKYPLAATTSTVSKTPSVVTKPETTAPEPEIISADPNNVSYPKTKLKLKDLFARKSDPADAENFPKGTYRILKNNRMLNLYGYASAIYTLEPGIYYISYAYYDDGSTTYTTKQPGLNSQQQVEYGAFEVKPNSVVYLGDIEFDWANVNHNKILKLTDNMQQVKQELLADNQESLIAKLTSAKFYPSGSKL